MNIDEKQLEQIVRNVLSGMEKEQEPKRHQLGVFDTMEEAIEALYKAYALFRNYNREQR